MIKKNKILVVCLALLLALSVGYALFSETITINGSATAKGNFEITTTIVNNPEEFKKFQISPELGDIVSSDIKIIDNVITTSATLGSPGSVKTFVIKVENTGTIPAILKDVLDEKGNKPETSGVSNFAGKEIINANKTSTLYISLFPDSNYFFDYETEELNPDISAPIEQVKEFVLDPGEITYYYMEYYWLDSSTSQEEISGSLNIELIWEQVTTN